MIRYLKRSDDGSGFENDGDGLWVHCVNPTEEEICRLIGDFKLPRDYITDALDNYEGARSENISQKDDKAALILLLYPYPVSYHGYPSYETRPVSMILVDGKLITVVKNDADFLPERLVDDSFQISEKDSAESLLLELVWKISQQYIGAVKNLELARLQLEEKLKNESNANSLYQVMSIQKGNVNLEDGIHQNGPVILDLKNNENLYSTPHKEELIHDLTVENNQGMHMVAKSSKMVSQLSETYQNVIATNLNVVMKVQTSISIILTIPTILGGIWGMNVLLPIAGEQHAFEILMGFTVVLCLIAYGIFKKMDYL